METLIKKYCIQVFGQVEYSSQTTYSVLRDLDEGQGLFDTEEEALSYMVHEYSSRVNPEPWFAVVPIYQVSPEAREVQRQQKEIRNRRG